MAYQIISVIIAAILQNSGAIAVLGIKPNLVLSAVLPLIFFTKNFWRYFLIILILSMLLAATPIWDLSVIIFSVFTTAAYFAKDFLPWQPFFNNLVLLIIVTIAINLPQFFSLEIIYNVFLGAGFYLIYAKTKN